MKIEVGKTYINTDPAAWPESMRSALVKVTNIAPSASAHQLAVGYSFIDTSGRTGDGTMQLSYAKSFLRLSAMTFNELPQGALLTHVIPCCAIDMNLGTVEVFECDSASAARIECAIEPKELWELGDSGRLTCIGGTSGDQRDDAEPLENRYTHYIKVR